MGFADESLKQTILKLLADGAMTTGEIRSKLNGFPLGLDVSMSDVHSALHSLLKKGNVIHDGKHLWRVENKAVRQARVRQLFVTRYPNKPTADDVVTFLGWLEGHYPHLLPQEKQGDLYQQLKSDLSGLYEGT
jgi:hypothetical protein